MTELSGVSVVIPNYNGERLLRDNLPSVIRAMEAWGGPHEVIVVDDCSSDDSVALMAEHFPTVRLLVNEANRGFSRTCNRGMAEVRYPVAICVNTDVIVEADLVAPLVRHFADPSVFAVTPNILAEREGKNQGIVAGLYGKGFIKGGFAPLEQRSGVRENLYAIGACVAYDMDKFRALGGYEELFTPYLFEDVDICYRAWKRGWRSLYEPGATVFHYSSATIELAGKRRKRTIYFRNRFLFHWLNLSDRRLVAMNMLHTALRLAVSFLWLDIPYYRSFFGALRRIGPVMRRRRETKSLNLLRDSEILRRTAGGNS
ncbi:glycosyltransferase family 2 protein [bacterium]|nr:glycosyltransferase family 2 protein [bacterium]